MSDYKPPKRPAGSNKYANQFGDSSKQYQSPQELSVSSNTTSLASNTTSSASNTTSTVATTVGQQQQSAFAQSAYNTAQYDFKQPPPSQPINLTSFEDTKFVVLDGILHEVGDLYEEVSGTFQWECFQADVERCIEFLRKDCAKSRVFLMVSGGIGASVVPQIHHLAQLYCVYVYCGDVKAHRAWTINYSKVRVVCNDDKKYLLPQLAVDVAQTDIEWGTALLATGKKEEAKKKFEKALKNLTSQVKNPDPRMIDLTKRKLEECK